jgi:hypothetical protein
MSDATNIFDRLTSFLETEEGQRSIEEFRKKLSQEADHRERQVERFKKYSEGRLDEVIKKIIEKYESDEYVRREYRLGYEPREKLLWVALGYAEQYCTPCEDPEYVNPFTGEMFYLGSYVIQVMHGQGSVIRIDKIK